MLRVIDPSVLKEFTKSSSQGYKAVSTYSGAPRLAVKMMDTFAAAISSATWRDG